MAEEKNTIVALPLSKPGYVTDPTYHQITHARKMRHAFREKLYNIWLQRGDEILERIVNSDPEAFAKIYLSSLPKEVAISVDPQQADHDKPDSGVAVRTIFERIDGIRKNADELAPMLTTEVEEYSPNEYETRAITRSNVIDITKNDE